MTPKNGWEKRPECPNCGNRYVPPPRAGAFRCSVCGRALPSEKRPAFAGPRGIGSLPLLAVAGLALALAAHQVNRPRAPHPAPPDPGVPAAERLRQVLVRQEAQWRRETPQRRLRHLQEVRQHPDRARPHLDIARDIYEGMHEEAIRHVEPQPRSRLAGLPVGVVQAPPPSQPDAHSVTIPAAGGPLIGAPQPRLRPLAPPDGRVQAWGRQVQRYMETRLKDQAARGLHHAEMAVRLAASASEEIEARRLRAEGLYLVGERAKAASENEWLHSVEPLAHWQLPSVRLVPDPDHRTRLRQIRQAIAAAERLEPRWPKDGALQTGLGALYLALGRESAALRSDYPRMGPQYEARVDAFINQRHPNWVRRGVAHCRRAVALAEPTRERAAALQALARGLLLLGRTDEAIQALMRARAAAPDLPDSQSDLAMALQRRAWQRERRLDTGPLDLRRERDRGRKGGQ